MLFGKEHVERYRATEGDEGHIWQNGSMVALLTTKGRKSGEERTTPLIYGITPEGEHMVVASKGGDDQPPAWYLNLQEDPNAELQVKADRFKVKARDAGPDEKPDLWKRMTAYWPDYDEYQKKTDREIPVVVLERI